MLVLSKLLASLPLKSTALPDLSTGVKMAKVNDLSVTAGTSIKYQLLFANQSVSKEARIRGVSLQY